MMKTPFKIVSTLFIFVLCIIAAGFWGLKLYHNTHVGEASHLGSEHNAQGHTPKVELASQAEIARTACSDNSPQSGGKYLLTSEDVDIKSSGKLYLSNEHAFPVWVRIFEVETAEEFGAIFLEPQKSSQFRLPINYYTIIVESGAKWCNFHQGFVDASIVDSDEVIQIAPQVNASLRLLSFGNQPSDMMVSLSNSAKENFRGGQVISGRGSLLLQRVVGGHYAVEGTVNHVPLQFLVDTGATTVSLPEGFAKRAGITACKKSKSRTANGIVDTCIAFARELSIGQFTLRNIEVSYGKGLPEDTFLLGMNVISQFKMEQEGNVMKLSL